MNDNINWKNIRIIDHTQEDGFEELVCQIARKEKPEDSKRFIQLGIKDEGLECFWELNNGKIIGWQAKYFTDDLESKWGQIRKSVKDACENYKNIQTMIIAIPCKPTKNQFEKSEQKIKKWKSEFENCPEIEFWWEGELNNFLSQNQYTGFRKFWFNNLEFTDEWFENQAKKSVENLGDKYNRVLNIKTDNKIYFDSISRNEDFKKYFYGKTHPIFVDINKTFKKLELSFEKLSDLQPKIYNIKNTIEEIKIEILKLDFEDFEAFNLNKINSLIEKSKNILKSINITFLDKTTQESFLQINHRLNNNLRKLKYFLNKNEIKITDNPVILFYGEAGMGKSFLFGEITETKIKNGENIVLLLGHQFERLKDPENIIVEELGLNNNYNFDDFLDALECKSYMKQSRIIVMIDALDDGKGPNLWNRYIKGFIDKISKRKRISFIFSIRTTFLNGIHEENPHKLKIPEQSNINKIEISGFQDNYKARIEFFKHYEIKMPNNYMLSPELNNPLFLTIFCKSIYNSGYHEIPNDLDGFSTIMNLYISSINLKLSHKCKYYPEINLVNEVLIKLIEHNMESQNISIEKANEIILNALKDYPFRHIFLQKLLEEGILIKYPSLNNELIINITFQRFKDYILSRHYVETLNIDQFLEFLKEIINNHTPHNKRLLDILSIYIPEKFDKEIYELLEDNLKNEFELMDSFIESLKWRRNSISEKIFEYIDNYILKNKHLSGRFLKILINLSSMENHLFNSYYTHNMLKQLPLSERDSFWTIFLHSQNNKNSEVNNLLNFAFLENHEYYSDENLKLASIMIAWFLSTTNKKLRDKSTYAIANLLKNKLNILKELLELFEDVDDTYILERLYAAAYGCVLNSSNHEPLEDLSNYIYETIFNQETVYPHILIRDYARNIIEFSLSKNCEFDDDLSIIKEKITPPYNSKFPKIPTDEEIEKYKTENKGVKRIFSSMLVEYDREGNSLFYGDFGRYTFQSYFTMWKNELKKKNIYFMDLMNIALEKIFKFNYDEDVHSYFDEHTIGLYEREENSERIGKKYQWMALYELLAQVSGKFPLIDKDYISNEEIIPYQGPWQDNIRNIDPTITFANDLPKLELKFEEKYPSENFLKENWIEHSQDLPDFSEIIELNTEFDEKNINGLILEGNVDWTRQPDFGSEKYPKKEIWSQIRSYIVKPSIFNKIIPILKHKNFNGRWMPESHENHELFNKEFFQSSAYDYFYENGWNEKDEVTINNKKYNLAVTTSKYSGSERSSIAKKNYLKVNKPIFKKLNLKYGKENSVIYDEHGNLVGFDAIEFDANYYNNLIFDKKMLLKYIEDNNLKIFFTVLGEKMIINEWDSKLQTFSGVYYFKDDNLKGSVNPYTECNFEELETSIAGIVKKVEMNMNNTFKRNLYIDYENKISYLFIKTNLCEFNAKKEFITTEKINENEWTIYSLDKNKIGKNYLNTISNEISEIKDSYIIYCIINGNYYNIIISSNFKQANSNHSTLYQQFIKPLLLNMRLTNYTFKKPYPKSRQLCNYLYLKTIMIK